MTHRRCRTCRLRLDPAHLADMTVCPSCEHPLTVGGPEEAIGYRLYEISDPAPITQTMVAAALARPTPGPTAQ